MSADASEKHEDARRKVAAAEVREAKALALVESIENSFEAIARGLFFSLRRIATIDHELGSRDELGFV